MRRSLTGPPFCWLLAGFLLALNTSPAGAATITVLAQKDANMTNYTDAFNDLSDDNFGDHSELVINWDQNARSIGLLEFDLSGIPTGATVTSAALSLYHIFNTQADPVSYDLFRVSSPWVEASVTLDTAPSIDLAAVASLAVSGPPGLYRTWDVTAVTAGWVSGAFSNYGLWIEEIPIEGDGIVYFSSSDDSDVGHHPRLSVTYIEATAVPEPASLFLLATGIAAVVVRRSARA